MLCFMLTSCVTDVPLSAVGRETRRQLLRVYTAKEEADFKDFKLVYVFRHWCIIPTTFA